MNDDTYKRGQVEWALWKYMNAQSNAREKPPAKFETRIKRLLELDRAGVKDTPGFAFSDEATAGRGSVAEFSPFDAFCLANGMDMLDVGFKQSEIVFFMAHVRPQLKEEYEYIRQCPLPLRQQVATEDAPMYPTYKYKGIEIADSRVYMVTQKIEITEVSVTKEKSHTPTITTPEFVHGIEALTNTLNLQAQAFRKSTLFELSGTANRITDLLNDAPEIRRGRP